MEADDDTGILEDSQRIIIISMKSDCNQSCIKFSVPRRGENQSHLISL